MLGILLAIDEPYLPLQLGGLAILFLLTGQLLRTLAASDKRVDSSSEARVRDLKDELKRTAVERDRERHLREAAEVALADCWRRHYGLPPGGG